MSVHRNHKAPGWVVRFREGDRNRSKTFALKRDAVTFDAAATRRRALGAALDVDAGQTTLAEFFEDVYWPGHAVPRLAPRTRMVYATVYARHVDPHLGGYRLRDLTPRVVDDWRVGLEQHDVGDPTIIKALGILQGVLRYATVRDEISTNPVREVDKPRQRRTRAPEPLSPLLVEAVRARLGPHDATLVSMLGYAGLRPGEAISARWEQFTGRALHVPRRKSMTDRQVHLLDPLAQDLREWQLACGRPEVGLIFPRAHGGEWAEHDWRNWRRRVYEPTARAAGVTGDLKPYRLRGSFASLLLWEGRPVTYVAAQLGHSVATLARHYAGVLEEVDAAGRTPAAEAIWSAREQVAGGAGVRPGFVRVGEVDS